ncbi:chorismate mutase [Salisediminibacterium halotolerans]|uniref:chorismate mutase n=1 Tax=Salisediminibacterium halotolerans TaxID=517425 RepID=UPI000EAEAD8F|nr:chorismate mutase [Salisediminibacterium halotolerans]RLJ77939.1 chorismate mutase [Actinophytocola xinjiangensis]RPE88723.1 chorismate mutase [Salisediminibacterium halotolerans]TWG36916.1 chorismate mutase [Salisediminibacterium halotolerans]GEL07398.1 chorismate mutase AroH [Salisediminibacterium halotolerans]
MIRGFRGATTVEVNEAESIVSASYEMVEAIIARNNLKAEDISHVWFTVTNDLNAAFPAKSLRQLDGYQFVPVMCAREIDVPDGIERCIRVMVTAETGLAQRDIQHVYLNRAVSLRPDLSLTNQEKSR